MCDTGWLNRLELGELANRYSGLCMMIGNRFLKCWGEEGSLKLPSCRVNSEVKAAKKRAKGHHERKVEAESRVKIAKRKAPALEKGEEEVQPEEEEAAALSTQQLLEEHGVAEEPDDSDAAPIFQRVFFPSLVIDGCNASSTWLNAAMHARDDQRPRLRATLGCPSHCMLEAADLQ